LFYQLESIVQGALSPVQGAVCSGVVAVKDWFYYLSSYRQVIAENRELRSRVEELDALETAFKELEMENERLRALIGFKQATEYKLVPAKVIAREASEWFSIITISKGVREGVQQDMPVVSSAGLVGRVVDANLYTSQVMLLTDPRSAVSVFIQRTRDSGVLGIVEGEQNVPERMWVTNILPDADVRPGDTIISSGMGGVFPKGLLIGEVAAVDESDFGLLKIAWIKPAVDFNHLEEVFVVIEVPEPEAGQGGNENNNPSQGEGAGE